MLMQTMTKMVNINPNVRRKLALQTAFDKFWPHMRAILIIFHVVAVLMMSFPAPAGVTNKGSWKDPSVVSEIHQWGDSFRSMGLQMSDEEFTEFLWELSIIFLDYRNKALKPFRPYLYWSGSDQSWRMFSAPHRYPVRFSIAVREHAEWRTIYETRSDEYTWNRTFFDHHRIRRLLFLYGWKKYRTNTRKFNKWIAKKVATEFPNAKSVKFVRQKYKTSSPKEIREGTRISKPRSPQEEIIDLTVIRKRKSQT